MSELVKRLRDYASNLGGDPEDYLTWQAADRIEALEAEKAAMISDKIKIENDIPVGRDTPVLVLLKTLLDLEVGQSFICPSGYFSGAEKARALANKRDIKVTFRATSDGWRFWRVR